MFFVVNLIKFIILYIFVPAFRNDDEFSLERDKVLVTVSFEIQFKITFELQVNYFRSPHTHNVLLITTDNRNEEGFKICQVLLEQIN